MVRSLRFANFKSWADPPPLRFGRITGLFGANSSGKSSVLQVMLMLKQTAESLDRSRTLHLGDDRTAVDLGTFYDIVRRHETSKGVEFEIGWELDGPLRVVDPARRSAEILSSTRLKFGVTVDQLSEAESGAISVRDMSYELG